MFECDQLLRVNQVSTWTGVSESTIRFWLSIRLLPKVRVGPRAVRIPRSAVERLIRDGTVAMRELARGPSAGTGATVSRGVGAVGGG